MSHVCRFFKGLSGPKSLGTRPQMGLKSESSSHERLSPLISRYTSSIDWGSEVMHLVICYKDVSAYVDWKRE